MSSTTQPVRGETPCRRGSGKEKPGEKAGKPVPSDPSALLADDDPSTLLLLATCARYAGLCPILASSGTEALHAAAVHAPLIAVLDISMPGATGFDVAQALHASGNAHVIFLSRHNQESYYKQAMESGAIAYYTKPVNPAQLILTMRATRDCIDAFMQVREAEMRLTEALDSNRDINTTIGILMERYKICREKAFHLLRGYARAQQRKMRDLAIDMLAQNEHFAQQLGTPPAAAAPSIGSHPGQHATKTTRKPEI